MTPEIREYLKARGKKAAKARWGGVSVSDRSRIMKGVRAKGLRRKKLSTAKV